jgi:opacity protein-like surface antigen
MKKVLSVMAVSAFVLTAGVALAGGPGKKMDAGCPEACQQQIDDLNSSQAQQNEQLGAHGKQLENHEGRISALEKDAYDPWYGRLGVRAAWMNQKMEGENNYDQDDWDTDAGWGGAVAFGRQFGQFRAELELAMQSTDLEDQNYGGTFVDGSTWNEDFEGDIDLTTVMVNGYYELPVYDAFSVYAMAGIGFAKYDMDATANYRETEGGAVVFRDGDSWGSSDNVFAYKMGAGVTYNFTEEMAADLGYEYLGVADTDIADSINGHNVVASFRYKF